MTISSLMTLLNRRFYAFSVDLFAIGIINKIILFGYANFIKVYAVAWPVSIKYSLMGKVVMVHPFTYSAVFLTYFTLSYFMGNRSLGNSLFSLKLVHMDEPLKVEDYHPGIFESFTRASSHLLSFYLLFIPVFFLYLSKKKIGPADWLSRTMLKCEHEVQKERETLEQSMFKAEDFSFDEPQLELFDLTYEEMNNEKKKSESKLRLVG